MPEPPKTDAPNNACVRCGEVLLGREPLCPHCQLKLAKALEVAGQPAASELRTVALARVAILFAVVGALGFLGAAIGVHLVSGTWILPWTALAALGASTSFVLLVGPLSIVESVRRAVSPGLRKLEATIGPSAGNRSFIVEAPLGSVGLLVVGDATLALYRAGARAAIDSRELAAVRSVEGTLGSSALIAGEDGSGSFGLLVFLRTRRPGNARRTLARTILAARKQTGRDEPSSPRPASPPAQRPAPAAASVPGTSSAPGASSAPASSAPASSAASSGPSTASASGSESESRTTSGP